MKRIRVVKRSESKKSILRIIPHQSVLNAQTRKLQLMLYELFSVRYGKFPWQHKEGWHIAIRPTPDMWWVTKMFAEEDGDRRIEFYVAMPEEFVNAFTTKFRNHREWKQCTLQQVDSNEYVFPIVTNTDVYKLKYKRHDMFSLSYDYSQQTTPIRDLLNVTNDLTAGESVDFFIRTEAMPRNKWKSMSDYAWDVWKRGGVPYRKGIDPWRMLRNLFAMVSQIVFEVRSLINDFMWAIESTFFHKDGSTKREKLERPVVTDTDREEILVNNELSSHTKNKRNMPVFKTSIRYAVHSDDEVRRSMIARSVANAYSDLGRDNKLMGVKVNIRSKQELDGLRRWHIEDMDPNLMSVDELGKLQQLPTSDLQQEFSDELQSNRRVEIEIPKQFLDHTGILVGTATDKGVTHNIHIPTKSKDFLFTPRAINGSPRMGKDQHIINLIVEAKRQHGIGAVIPDFIDEREKDKDGNWRGMANAIRDHLPPEDVIDIDFTNSDYSFYLGLMYVFNNVPDQRIAADIISEYLTDFLMAEGDEDKFQTMEFAREAAKVAMGDLIGMKQLFVDSNFRKQKIDELQDQLDMTVWEDYDKLTDEKTGVMSNRQGQLAAPVLRRISQLMGREFLKTMFCQTPNPAAQLYQWIYEGKVVIFRVRMPGEMVMPESVKEILGYWIVLLAFLIKLSQGGKGAGTYLVLNEPHQFLSKGLVHFLERMLSEGPKYRLTPIIAFHDFSQFKRHPGFVDMLLASSLNWHLFKNTNSDVYKRLMPYLSKTFTDPQQAFESTKAYQYIAVWHQQGEYEPPFIVDALPMVKHRYPTLDNSNLTLEHIKWYGKSTKSVLAEFKERNRVMVRA